MWASCGVRKIFRRKVNIGEGKEDVVKLSDKKIRRIVKHCYEIGEVSTKEAAEIYHITQRRVQQIVREYRMKGEIPVLKKNRRPKTYLTEEQKKIIEELWRETRVGARLL